MDNGIIKKVDELGRIVIPKDIRKNLKINNGDVLKISVDGQNIQLAKYSDVLYNVDHIKRIFDAFVEIYKIDIIFTDRENVLLSTKEDFSGQIDKELIQNIENSENVFINEEKTYSFNNNLIKGFYYFVPIITSLSTVGSIIIYSQLQIKEFYQDILKFISKYVAKLVDISC